MDLKGALREQIARTKQLYPRNYKDVTFNISRSTKKVIADTRTYARNILGVKVY